MGTGCRLLLTQLSLPKSRPWWEPDNRALLTLPLIIDVVFYASEKENEKNPGHYFLAGTSLPINAHSAFADQLTTP
jgi:hypothetical protein